MAKYEPMLIDANEIITTMVMDEKTKTGTLIKMPIADALDKWTVEGCSKPVETKSIKHRRWIEEGLVDGNQNRYCRCSECGKGDTQAISQRVPYCWWCGAKMDDNWEEPEINPCRGCRDYDGKGGCISNGGCGRGEEEE